MDYDERRLFGRRLKFKMLLLVFCALVGFGLQGCGGFLHRNKAEDTMFHVSVVVVNALGDPMSNCIVSFTSQSGDGNTNLMATYTNDTGILNTRVHGGVWDVTADCMGDAWLSRGPVRHATKTVDIRTENHKIHLIVP